MFHASYDQEVDAYYFRTEATTPPIANTVSLENRTVNLDIDHYGRIVGIEVL